MAIAPLVSTPGQAFSAFDFSPLARLGNLGKQSELGDLAQRYETAPSGGLDDLAKRYEGTASTTPQAPYTGDKQAVAKQVTSELKAQGLSDNAIAGILYNIGQESSFDPTLRHADQPRFGGEAHYAHGLFQEGGDEYNTWAAHMQARGLGGNAWQDPVEQARFVAGRLKGEIGNSQYADVLKALQQAKTSEDAARVFASGYLKPAAQYLQSRYANISGGVPGIGYYTGE